MPCDTKGSVCLHTFKFQHYYLRDFRQLLMTDNYRVLYLQSSGSIHTNNDRYAPLEFSNFYLKVLFENIMGFDHYFIARSQGTDLQDANQAAIIKRASQEINRFFVNCCW